MAAIADLIVKMSADTSKFTTEIQKTNTYMKGFQSTIKTIGRTLATFGLAFGAGTIFKSFIANAKEAEEVEKRLRYAMELHGYQWSLAKRSVDQFANSMQRSTRFSDEQARQALTDMFMYTENFTKAQMGAVAAMDLSTRLSMDMATATKYIGMAMSGNVEMLGRYIPEFRNLKDILGDNATQAEKAAYAFKIINEKFGGTAQKDVETYAGRMDQLKNSVGDFAEAIGLKMLPALEWAATKLKSFFDIATQMATRQKTFSFSDMFSGFNIDPFQFFAKNVLDMITTKLGRTREEWASEARYIDQWQKTFMLQIDKFKDVGVPDWIAEWVRAFDPLSRSFEILKVTSQRDLSSTAEQAVWAIDKISQGFEAGVIHVKTYRDSLKAALEEIKKVTGETADDTTEKLVELSIEYEKRAKEIRLMPDDEERKKAMSALIEEHLKARAEIQKQGPVAIRAEITQLEAEIEKSKVKLEPLINFFKEHPIEPIDIKVKTEGIFDPLEQEFQEMKRKIENIPIIITTKVVAEGSKRMSFSDYMKYMDEELGGIENIGKAIDINLKFLEFSERMVKYRVYLAQIQQIMPSITRAVSAGGGNIFSAFDPILTQQVRQAESDLIDKISAFMREFASTFRGSMQGGGYVGRTGLYKLHQGERVVTSNNVSFGNININVPSGTSKEMARNVAKQLTSLLKYKRINELQEQL